MQIQPVITGGPDNNKVGGLQNAGKVIPEDFTLKCRLTYGRAQTPKAPGSPRPGRDFSFCFSLTL
jgi:hypothetical protein